MIVIDEEFKKLIPPLTADEFAGLEKSLLDEGCRDALVLWGNTLVDGHNRYEICTKYHIPFETVQKEFASRDDVMIWMIDTQFGRRNLEKIEMILLAQKKAPILERMARKSHYDAVSKSNSERAKKNPIFVKIDNDEKTDEPLKCDKIETVSIEMYKTKLYRVWCAMKQRCNNPRTTEYHRYGGRGISVCKEWNDEHGFDKFMKWALTHGYSQNLEIDRINNNGNYEPSNCRFVTHAENMKNRGY